MPGHSATMSNAPKPYPLRVLVRDLRRPGRWGVLISYGDRAARVKFSATVKGSEWVPLIRLQMIPVEELAERLRTEGRTEAEIAMAVGNQVKELV